jgi:hypothetical protein
MKRYFLYLLLLVCFGFSCSKSNVRQSIINTEQLVNKKWKFSASSAKLPNGVITDNYFNLPVYQQDDFYLFMPDFTFTYNDNGDRIPGSIGFINYEGSWSLSNGDPYINLTVTVQGNPLSTFPPQKILELSTTTMRWEWTDNSTGIIYWNTYTVIP